MMKRFTPFLLLIVFGNSCVFAAGWKNISSATFIEQIKSVVNKINNAGSYSVNLSMYTYEGDGDIYIHDRSSGYVKFANGMNHSLMMGVESVQDKDRRVVIDSTSKIISLTNKVEQTTAAFIPEYSEELLKKAVSISVKEENGQTSYKLYFESGYLIREYRLVLNKNQHISRIDIVYDKILKGRGGEDTNLKFRMLFENWELPGQFSAKDFSTDPYIIMKGNVVRPTSSYRDFIVSDQRVKF